MRLLLLAVAVLLITSPVMAVNFYEGFESCSPGYLNLPGWLGNGAWNVVAGSALNGTKAIAPAGANDLYCPYSGVTFRDGTVASIDVRMSTTSGSFFSWNLMNDEAPFVGLCWYTDGLFRYAVDGYGWNTQLPYTMYLGHKYRLTATLSFSAKTVAYGVNDLTDPTKSFGFSTPFGLPTSPILASNGGAYLSGVGTEFDNLAVTSPVPEPSALAALGTGLIGVCGFAIRRRK